MLEKKENMYYNELIVGVEVIMNNNMYSDYVEWMNRTWDPDVKEKYDKLMIQFISEPDAQKKQGIEQQLKEIVSKQYDLYTSKAADTMLQSEEKLAELDKEKQRLQNEIANLNSRVYPEHMDNLNVKNELQNVSAQKEELNKQKEEILKKGQERTDVIAKLEKDISDLRDINNLKHILLIGYSRSAEGYISRINNNPQWGYVVSGIQFSTR